MTEFIIDSLELIPGPAALFECPGFVHVACNSFGLRAMRERAASDPHAQAILDSEDDHVDRCALYLEDVVGLDMAPFQHYCGSGKTEGLVTQLTTQGWYTGSVLPTAPELTRPDLMLITVSPSGHGEQAAKVAHERAVQLLQVNEASERTMRMLEDALLQVQTAVHTQRSLIARANRRNAEITRLLNDAPPGVSLDE